MAHGSLIIGKKQHIANEKYTCVTAGAWPDFLTGDFLLVNTHSQGVITPLLSLRAPDLILSKYAKENGPTMSLRRSRRRLWLVLRSDFAEQCNLNPHNTKTVYFLRRPQNVAVAISGLQTIEIASLRSQ